VMEGGVKAELKAAWPRLEVSLAGYDTCRDLTVEEYAEDHITEKTSSAAGPSLSTGISTILASGILFGISYALSNTPDRTRIDGGGNFAPSTRQYVQGASLVSLIIGVPALAVGLITSLRTGEDTVSSKVEQIASQKDAPCNGRPITGPVLLDGDHGAVTAPKTSTDGVVAFDVSEVKGPITGVVVFGRDAELDADAERVLDGFNACAALEALGARAPESLSDEALATRADLLRQCRPVRGDALAGPLEAVEAEQDRRRGADRPPPDTSQPVHSFEEARALYAPSLKLTRESVDLKTLQAPEAVSGHAALLEGVVSEAPVPGAAAQVAVVQVGDAQVFLGVPPKAPWAADLRGGNRIEAVVVVAGWSTVSGKTLPLLRGVWVRNRF